MDEHDDELDELIGRLEAGEVTSAKVDSPIDLLLLAAEMLDWRVAIPPADADGNIDGIVIGKQAFIEDELLDSDKYEIHISENESVNDKEL